MEKSKPNFDFYENFKRYPFLHLKELKTIPISIFEKLALFTFFTHSGVEEVTPILNVLKNISLHYFTTPGVENKLREFGIC